MQKRIFGLSLIFSLFLLVTPGFAQGNETPFTASEFMQFLEDVPSIPGFTAESQEAMDSDSGGDVAFSEAIRDQIKALGWDEERFLYIYSQTISVLSIEQMQQGYALMQAQLKEMPADQRQAMEQMMGGEMSEQMTALKADVDSRVPASEQSIIIDNIEAAYAALGIQKQ